MKNEGFFVISKSLKNQKYCDTMNMDPSIALCPSAFEDKVVKIG